MNFRALSGYLILLSSIAISACSDSDSGRFESGDGGGPIGQPDPIEQPDFSDFPEVIRVENTLPEIDAIAGLCNNGNTEEGGLGDTVDT